MGAQVLSIQTGWRMCAKCGCLWYSGNGFSKCPAGGAHVADLCWAVVAPNSTAYPGQSNWRWCKKCQCMFFAGNATQGVCVAGGTHDKSQSGDYTMTTGNWDADFAVQGWRWCRKCQVMHQVGFPKANRCHAGGLHDATQSGKYIISFWFT